MWQSINLLFRQVAKLWSHFGANQKVSIIISLVCIAAFIGGLLYWTSRPSYGLLYSGLSMEDAAAAAEKIREERIPVELRDSGRTIMVPAGDVYRARLLLAAAGLPKKSTSGLELFEQPKFGLTDFAQRVNHQRALQGELERTIMNMDGIQSVKVMLVLPSERLFAPASERKASASIIITTLPDATLGAGQVRSIRHLVASAVQNLDPTAVTISDQLGRLLSRGAGGSDVDGSQAAGEQMEMQEKTEQWLAQKAQTMLDGVLGAGHSIVRVNTTMDFSKVEKRRENYDGDKRVAISEKTSTESKTAPSGVHSSAAIATVPVQDPNKASIDQSMNKTKKEDSTTEYRVPSDTEHVVLQGARIQHLTVSVCVAKGEQARSKEELKRIENLVRNAVGFVESTERTDTIQVDEMSFPAPQSVPAPTSWQSWQPIVMPLATKAGTVLGILLALWLVYRHITRFSVQSSEVGIPIAAVAGGGGKAAMGASMLGTSQSGMSEGEITPDDIAQLAESNPKAVAAWITSVSRSDR